MACVAREPEITRELLHDWLARDAAGENGLVVLEARAADIARFALAQVVWQDAGRAAWQAWTQLRDATTTAQFVSAFEALANAMPDLGSWLPDWNADKGELDEFAEYIECPRCHMRSYHPKDIEHGYCGNCHEFTTKAKVGT